jgi:hypothetical protein
MVIFDVVSHHSNLTLDCVWQDWKPCAAGSRIDGEFEMRGSSMLTIPIEPNSMVTEQFIAR